MHFLIAAGLALLLLVGRAAGIEPVPPATPKLVVVIVIDQFRADYLQRFRPYFSSGGFNRFLRQGATFTQAAYQQAVTLTCPGHAVILTGAYPAHSGIVANQWYDRNGGHQEYCAEDSTASLIGVAGPGRSPRNLIGSTVGDELRRSNGGRSRVITIAGKDRAAIMLGGHQANAAYWMEDSLVVTSTYYRKELPDWVREFNAAGRIRAYAGRTWDRLLPTSAYVVQGADFVTAEQNVAGMGRVFPHHLPPDSSSRFFDAFPSSPFQDEVLVQFAEAAVSNEHLGEDDEPDLLAISFSANDLIGHAFGPNSHEVMDVTVRTDRLLQELFTFLDQRVGRDNLVMVLTADHGVAPLPELVTDPRIGAKRLNPTLIANASERALRSRFGAPPTPGWLLQIAPPWIYLNGKALEQRGFTLEEAERTTQSAAQRVPGVQRAFTATELSQQQERGVTSAAALSFNPQRSGDVYYELKPYVISAEQAVGTTHGSPWSYDTRVPLLWFGSSVKRGAQRGPASIADIAPTLCFLLGIPAPAGGQGRVLQELLR
jgi:predicted AlkP superfamily pyrophosphatase or phosphodiesterase